MDVGLCFIVVCLLCFGLACSLLLRFLCFLFAIFVVAVCLALGYAQPCLRSFIRFWLSCLSFVVF